LTVPEALGAPSDRRVGPSPLLPGKTMTTADAGRLKARRRPRPKVDTRGVQKTPAATKESQACWPPVSRGVQSRTSRAAAAQQSRRSPNATAQPLDASVAARLSRRQRCARALRRSCSCVLTPGRRPDDQRPTGGPAGATSLRAIAAGLNVQGIPTARGQGEWSAVQVARVLERIDR
jgi:hypothetical protein